MCINGNSAPLSVRYLNAQLTALWQNAVECVKYAEHHGSSTEVNLHSQDYDRHKYQRALAQFHYVGKQRAGGSISKEDLFFNASFAQPRIEFICNHEAALYLKIEKGHLNKAFTKSQSTGSKFRISRSENVPIEGLEIAYRMKFTQTTAEGHDSRIGHGKGYMIQLMILDFENAELVMFRSKLAHEVKEALKFYLGQYMQFLVGGGQNCLLNLPDFDDDAYTPVIDYSLTTKAIEEELCNDITVYGNSVDDINEHLRRAWLKVAVLENPPADKLSLLLTEIQTNWLGDSDSHFHVRFAPPTVKALCSEEVVVYYNIDEITFYDSADFKTVRKTASGWRIAFVVAVIEERLENDVVIIKLDFDTARFCRHLSAFTSTEVDVKIFVEELVEFMTHVYVDLVVQYECTILWRNDVSVVFHHHPHGEPIDGDSGVDSDDGEPPHSPHVEGGIVKTEKKETKTITTIIKETTCYHFDQMVTVSEETVNRVFATWWLTAKKSTHIDVLYRYEVEQFKVTFKQPRIQLLSDGRALVWITIESGKMIVDGKEAIVGDWRIAVECKLKMVEHKDLGVEQSWFGRFKDAVFGKSQDTTKTVKHVVLDVSTATIVRELCVFDGMFESGAKLAVLRTRAIERYIFQYMKAFAQAGYHIVHSTPIYGGADAEFGWTSVDFRVVSQTTVTVTNVTHKHEAPVIVVVGMTHNRPLPTITTIHWHAGLVIRSKRISYGTVTLASKSFLQRAILERLAVVNAKTTIVPRYPKVDEEEWKVYLSTWYDHSHRKTRDCHWKLDTDSAALTSNALKYTWHHKDVWAYERQGTLEVHGSYNVECETRNELHLPTNFRAGGMDIVVSGKTSLRLKNATDAQQWSRSSTSTWSATIHVTSEWDGLHVRLGHTVKPTIHSEKVHEHGQSAIAMNTQDMLQAHMPQIVDFGAVISELKETLEGTWRYAVAGLTTYRLYSPVFNIHGDLVVQVRPYDPSARPPPAPVAPAPVAGSMGRQSSRGTSGSRTVSVSRPAGKKRPSLFDRAKEFVHDVVKGEDHDSHGEGHTHKSSTKAEKPSAVSRTSSTASTSSTSSVSSSSSVTSVSSAHSVHTVTGKSGSTTISVSSSSTPVDANGHANGHAHSHENGSAKGPATPANGSANANGSAKAPATPKAQQPGLNLPAGTLRPL